MTLTAQYGAIALAICRCHDQPKRLPVRPVRRPLGPDRARLTAWRQARTDAGVSGRTPTHDLREIFNAILYLNRTGIAWRYLPHDFPPYRTVYGYFAAWSKEGIFTELNYELTGLVRDHHGRQIEPTASIMDTQSVKTSTNVPAVTQGIDAGKMRFDRARWSACAADPLGRPATRMTPPAPAGGSGIIGCQPTHLCVESGGPPWPTATRATRSVRPGPTRTRRRSPL